MKISKNIILLSITIVILISLVAIATYSYFTASINANNKITTNVKMPMRPTFAVSGGGELALTVDRSFTLQENAYNGTWVSGKNYYQINKSLKVTLTGEVGTTCSYNIYYKDTSSNGSYVYTNTGSGMDFEIKLNKNNTTVINWFDYKKISQTSAGTAKITALTGGSTSPFNTAKPTITIPSGATSANDTWTFYFEFDNREWDQSTLAGKTFKGELYVGDVSCT